MVGCELCAVRCVHCVFCKVCFVQCVLCTLCKVGCVHCALLTVFFVHVMGDLKQAPAVHFIFPLQSFSLYLTFKSGIAAFGEPIPSEQGRFGD